MKPKFQIGETVILQSVGKPEFNGEYEVEGVYTNGDTATCVFTGNTLNVGFSGVGYRLSGASHEDLKGQEAMWAESALRKKHEGSDDSFEEMMSKLKCGETA